jgi:hypothetical protein
MNRFNGFSAPIFSSSIRHQARRGFRDEYADRKTVETVVGSYPSLFTAINRGVNEKSFLLLHSICSSERLPLCDQRQLEADSTSAYFTFCAHPYSNTSEINGGV